MKRKSIYLALAIVFMIPLLFSGCNSKEEEQKLKVSVVVAGNLGDKSFFDSANEGVKRATDELKVEAKVYECNNDPTFYSEQLNTASEYGSVVVVVGYEFFDLLKEMAKVFPKVNYVYVDNIIEGVPNITCIDYNETEGSFLAGAFSVLMLKEDPINKLKASNSVGMVGGMDIPVIRSFITGYEQGAKYIDPKINVKTVFAGDFIYPKSGKKVADKLYKDGVNIVFQAAGSAGMGVLDAAKEANRYAIGVDSDQRHLDPEHILASMTKSVGLSIFESIQRIQDGTFKPGTVYPYGLKENGVALVYGDETNKKVVPDNVKAKIQEISEKIVSGEIKCK